MKLEGLTTEHIGRRITVHGAGHPAVGVLTGLRRAVNRYPVRAHGDGAPYEERTWVTVWIDGTVYEPLEGWLVDVDVDVDDLG
ncbi:hypothetical protein DEO23_06590 [Brachybacterium endophyticum]|uniref:Uncharacterized protein n=1 Tax=Brachybacterium endophyticum TaxID=2182385 RepID=A0A2U2RL64_9MICO|nr:hypothetical protein [Brachybacterium endophyticum]PWH06613.1 hypothetical protein DEO23_06590 [Brachybacterium endophyticum]